MICVFDLDGTLAQTGKGVKEEDRRLLFKIAEKGHRFAVCSGKPVYYLCGFMRELGIENPILIGENGAEIQFGIDLPPKQVFYLPVSERAKCNIRMLGERIGREFGEEIWCQPNEVCYTPFPKTQETFEKIAKFIRENPALTEGLSWYRHGDSFDFVPENINKFNALQYLSGLLGRSSEEFVAVGDGVNDYPMFAFAGCSLGINIAEAERVDRNFPCLTDALLFILQMRGENE